MSVLLLVFFLLLAPFVHSKPLVTIPYISHEKTENVPAAWTHHGRALAETKVKARLALTQNNVELGAEHLLDISNPSSQNYGQ